VEKFNLTTKVGKNGKIDLVLEMRQWHMADIRHSSLLRSWKVTCFASPATEKWQTVLRLAERRGILINADWPDAPKTFDGSAREFGQHLIERRGNLRSDLMISDHHEGMRLAMAFMLAGRCNSIGKMTEVVNGLTNLEMEVVLYWFTLCQYGQRTKAGKAALFTLLNTKG
jgi:hypothetical protein